MLKEEFDRIQIQIQQQLERKTILVISTSSELTRSTSILKGGNFITVKRKEKPIHRDYKVKLPLNVICVEVH